MSRFRTLLALALIVCSSNTSFSTTLEASPGKIEVCFSPDDPCDDKLIDFVKSAQKSIDIAIYDINLDQLVHQLLIKSKSIAVRVLVDNRQSKGNHSLVSTLIKGGIQVRFGHQKGIMHNKFTIIDNARLETGSFNYTNHASRANNENQIYLSDLEVVGKYRERFEKIWGKGKVLKVE